ncbi:MAG: DASS family sodium-coupled anion symporter [Allobranchiibius sp.]
MGKSEDTAKKTERATESSSDGFEEIETKSAGERADEVPAGTARNRWIGLAAGLVVAVVVYLIMPAGVSHPAKLTAATALLMGIWWMTEAIPIAATALLPLIIFPTLNSKVSMNKIGSSYGSDIIFLFMGGFLLALAMQRWNLHRRIALVTVRAVGTKPVMVIGGFMVATAFLSMWVSNTATAVMMLPIGVSVLVLVASFDQDAPTDGDGKVDVQDVLHKTNFGTAMMLGIAYAASIGSLATIIGTPPNTLLVGYLKEEQGIDIGFGQWMIAGLPLAIVFLVLTWFLLTKVLFKPEMDQIPGGRELIDQEISKLGAFSQGEMRVGVMFVAAAVSWVSIPLIWDDPIVSDAGIAMIVGVLLFLLPAGAARGVRLLDWETAIKLPWGVLLLFGGGLALSSQFSSSGLTKYIGQQAEKLGSVPIVLLVLLVTAGVIFLTELTSNTATAATFLPVAGGVALGLDLDPLLLTVPVALAASCAFMLPVATPPNAVAYGSGYVTIANMVKGGFWLNLIGIVLITGTMFTLMTWALGIRV